MLDIISSSSTVALRIGVNKLVGICPDVAKLVGICPAVAKLLGICPAGVVGIAEAEAEAEARARLAPYENRLNLVLSWCLT
jgi:hypothetical protein